MTEIKEEAGILKKAQNLKGADFVVTGDVTEFGRKDVGDKQLFGLLGRGKTQIAYAKVNLTIDAWVVIAILGVMFVISMLVIVTKILYANTVDTGNNAFLRMYREAGGDPLKIGEVEGKLRQNSAIARIYRKCGSAAAPLEAAFPGVTRDVVLLLARRAGLDVREAPIAAAALDRADEILLTSSIAEVVPVVVLDGRPVGSGRPGPVALRLQELYRAFLARSLAATTPRGRRRPSIPGPHPPSRRGAWRSQARLARGRP
jgi:hypothetical protein